MRVLHLVVLFFQLMKYTVFCGDDIIVMTSPSFLVFLKLFDKILEQIFTKFRSFFKLPLAYNSRYLNGLEFFLP